MRHTARPKPAKRQTVSSQFPPHCRHSSGLVQRGSSTEWQLPAQVRPHKQHRPQQMIFHRRAFRGGPECNSQRPTARSNALQPGPDKKQNDRPYCGRDDAADQPWYEGNAQQRKMKAETIEGRVSARPSLRAGGNPKRQFAALQNPPVAAEVGPTRPLSTGTRG
jgi:hypothetical protein